MKKRRVMVVTAGRHQAPLILKAKALGCEVLATDQNTNAASFMFADHTAVVDSVDTNSLLRIARNFVPDAIVTEQTDVAVPSVALVAETLGLPGIGVDAAIRATDKFAMREACKLAGIPTPKYQLATTPGEAIAAANEIGFPVIVKPIDNQSSRGVTRVKNEKEMQSAAIRAFAASRRNRILIEEMMVGSELSVESFICGDNINVLGVSEKLKCDYPFAFDRELIYPGDYSPARLAEIEVLNASVIRAVGITMGFAHAEMIITPNGIRLIEIAARGCGARIATDLLPRLTNIDLLAARILQAMGETVKIPEVAHESVGIVRFFDLPEGRIRAIRGLQDAAAEPGVVHLDFVPSVGDEISTPQSGDQRPGFVIGISKSRAEACALADKVMRLVEVDVA
jgi:biotin carboxylase